MPQAQLLNNVDIVLSRPRYGGNIGSVARAIANMGLGKLVLAAPEDYLPAEARMMAASAAGVLGTAGCFDTLDQALGGYDLVLGTSRRRKSGRQRIMTPREAAAAIMRGAATGPVALVFGSEDSGLSGREAAICHGLVSIPADEKYPSLNLAQAVMVMAYELRMSVDETHLAVRSFAGASAKERQEVLLQMEAVLERSGFFSRNPRERVMLHISEILSGGVRTSQDARILRGVFRRIAWALGNQGKSYSTGERR